MKMQLKQLRIKFRTRDRCLKSVTCYVFCTIYSEVGSIKKMFFFFDKPFRWLQRNLYHWRNTNSARSSSKTQVVFPYSLFQSKFWSVLIPWIHINKSPKCLIPPLLWALWLCKYHFLKTQKRNLNRSRHIS